MRRTLLLLAVSSLVSCTRGGNGYYGATQPKHGADEAWSNLGSEPDTIDPGKAAEQVGGTLAVNLFAGLTQAHPQTLDPMPDIAERWDISEDGLHYVFHLRESSWSDGVPLTAADFEYTWRRVLDPKTGSRYATFLYGLKHGELFNRKALCIRGIGSATEAELRALVEPLAPVDVLSVDPELDAAFVIVKGDDASRPKLRRRLLNELRERSWQGRVLRASEMDGSEVGVRARDARTLVVELEAPLPYFLHITKYYTALPVPRHVLERLERAGQNTDLWTRPENIVSNGAYVLAEARFRQFIRLQKNPRYWDRAHVKLQRIRLSLIENYNTVLNMYEAGELDAIGPTTNLPSEFLDQLRKQKDFVSAPYMNVYFYWVNTKVAPVDDPRVRMALSLAIDRKSVVTHVMRAGQIPTADIVPDGLGGYKGLNSPSFDPERARALLRDAGYGPDRPVPAITLRYNTSESHKQVAEAVQAMWRTHLGIQVEIENQEWKVYLKTLETKDFQLGRYGWIGDYPDPFTFLELLTTHNGNNKSNWSNSQYDELLRLANLQRDPALRLSQLREAEQIFARELPVIPIYVYTRSELVKPYLRGHALNYECRYMYKYWWIDERWFSGQPSDQLPHGFPPPPAASPRGGTN
ncbi:MAG TPA: peptide ABC transporter substrate-binding protein [Polyangiales bacterium]|nr:peptide ABC transporter substrate-binding protein [Polyangiales bacterium]